jgi:sulfite reductase alpha subunit
MAKHATPLLDQLESGPWPSFVSDLKQEAASRAKNEKNVEFQIPQDCVEDLLGVLELSYKHGVTHWKHGGIVGVFGYGGGVIGRYCDQPQEFPGVAHFHTMRVNQPGGKYYTTEFLKKICDLWEFRGSGVTNMHGSTGDIIFIGTTTPQLEEIFYELTHNFNQDLGGSGSNLRTPSDCIGSSRCEYSCYDTQAICYALTQEYQDELHRPAFPYKFKFKFDGCPNCCVASIARADISFVGTWKDDIKIDQEAVAGYVGGEFAPNGGAHSGRDWGAFDIDKEVCDLCPTHCMKYENGKLLINNRECTRCMHCINVMPRALHIGDDRGCSMLVGAKAPILDGAQMGSLLVPFIKVEEPYDEIKEVIEGIWDWWMEEGKNRERLGELIKRQGFQKLLEMTNIKPVPQHVQEPRHNPYIFWKEDEVEGGWDRDINAFRKTPEIKGESQWHLFLQDTIPTNRWKTGSRHRSAKIRPVLSAGHRQEQGQMAVSRNHQTRCAGARGRKRRRVLHSARGRRPPDDRHPHPRNLRNRRQALRWPSAFHHPEQHRVHGGQQGQGRTSG